MAGKGVSRQLRDAQNKMVELAARAAREGPLEKKLDYEMRVAALDREFAKYKSLSEREVVPKRVFLSYSAETIGDFAVRMQKRLERARFEVVSGFEETKESDGHILKSVLQQLRRSSFYLAILTPTLRVEEEGKVRWAPSVWVSEEKGMALALEKPFLLMVHEDIHDDFWRKTTPEKAHVFFANRTFETAADDAVLRVEDRYHQYVRRVTRIPEDPNAEWEGGE